MTDFGQRFHVGITSVLRRCGSVGKSGRPTKPVLYFAFLVFLFGWSNAETASSSEQLRTSQKDLFELGLKECIDAMENPTSEAFSKASIVRGDLNSGLTAQYNSEDGSTRFPDRLRTLESNSVGPDAPVFQSALEASPTLADYVLHDDTSVRAHAKDLGFFEIDLGPIAHFANCGTQDKPILIAILSNSSHRVFFEVLSHPNVEKLCDQIGQRKESNA